jgi:hypothetical protein
VFGGGDVGVDTEGVDKASRVDVLTEASYFGLPMVLAKVILQRCLAKAMLV